MKIKQIPMLASATCILATIAHATIISIPNLTQTPTANASNVEEALGETVSPNTDGSLSYVVATYTFGTDSLAHIQSWFDFSGGQNRLGVQVEDNGVVSFMNQGDTGDTTFDITVGENGSMAGQSVTMIWRSYYHSTNAGINDPATGLRDTLGAGDDMLMNVWVNPTVSATETAVSPGDANMLADGDLHTLWNSYGYAFLTQQIQNQTTLAGAGDNKITNMTVLTGTDATFANALALATIPEPSSAALLGLGGLALILRRRK